MPQVTFSDVINDVTEIYKEVPKQTGLQMCKNKFSSIKCMRRSTYAKFGTSFLRHPVYTLISLTNRNLTASTKNIHHT